MGERGARWLGTEAVARHQGRCKRVRKVKWENLEFYPYLPNFTPNFSS